MSNSIKNIVDNIEINNLKKKVINNKKIFEIVEKFIKNKKLILYGGYALNLILPKNKKIYRDYTSADFDCYSYSAKKDSIQLAKKLKKMKYKLIKVKLAKHENTYKLYVGTLNVLDITQLDKKIFDIFIKIHKYEKHNNLLIHYDDSFNIIPLYLMKRNMHYELARPEGSYYRWEKIYNRSNILDKVYFTKNFNELRSNCKLNINDNTYLKIPNEWNNCINKLLYYIKKKNCPIIDNYAIKLINNIRDKNCCRINTYSNILVILTKKYKKTCNDIIKIINNTIDEKKYKILKQDKTYTTSSVDILETRYRVVLEDISTKKRVSLISIINVANNCFSIQKIKGYTVGSIDTILCFLYSYYLTYLIAKYLEYRHNTVLEDTQQYINLYENMIHKIKSNKRLLTNCYGKEISKDDIYLKNWDKKLSILKI
tara:strand:- start:23336 stop:24616 length:1281 start_codon:yes stop_codon:yes gene_type:complete